MSQQWWTAVAILAGAPASTLARVTFAVTVIASDYLDIESTGARKAKSTGAGTI